MIEFIGGMVDCVKSPKQPDPVAETVIPIIGEFVKQEGQRDREPQCHAVDEAELLENQNVQRQRYED